MVILDEMGSSQTEEWLELNHKVLKLMLDRILYFLNLNRIASKSLNVPIASTSAVYSGELNETAT